MRDVSTVGGVLGVKPFSNLDKCSTINLYTVLNKNNRNDVVLGTNVKHSIKKLFMSF